MRKISFFILTLCLVAVVYSYGQQATLRIIDSKTGNPVLYAHVQYINIATGEKINHITDKNGEAPNDISAKSIAGVSFVGYKTLFDTIFPGQDIVLELIPEIVMMDQVVVTAQYTPERIDKSIYKVNVINKAQIEQKGANNIKELLSNELNIRTRQDGALGSSLSIMGLSGEHVKFLVDGVPVIGRLAGNIDLSQLNLYNVDHIEIIEGPMSVIYGSNALAGVVNIITKENKNIKLQGTANAYLESVGVYNFDGQIGFNQKNHSGSFSGGRNFFDGYSTIDSGRADQWKPKRQYFLDGYYKHTSKKSEHKISGTYFNEKLLSKGNLVPPYNEHAFDNEFHTKRYSLKLDNKTTFKSKRYLVFNASYSNFNREKITYRKDLTTLEKTITPNDGDQSTSIFQAVTSRATFSKSNPRSKFNYQLGVDMNYETGNGEKIEGDSQNIGDLAGFLSIKYAPFNKLLFQPGVRLIYNTRFEAPLVYSLSVKWDIHNVAVRTSFSRGFRAPSLKELYLYFVDINHNIQGNKNLKAEKSYNLNVSFDYKMAEDKAYFLGQVVLFYNNINNIITLANLKEDLYTYINLEKYITQGIQLSTNYRLYPWFSFKTGVIGTGRLNTLYEERPDQNKFKYSADFIFNTSYKWLKYDINILAEYKFTGKTTFYYLDENAEVAQGFLGSYNFLDLSLQKMFLRQQFSVTAGIKNILNVQNIPSAGSTGVAHSGGSSNYPAGWGRTVFVKLSYTFKQY